MTAIAEVLSEPEAEAPEQELDSAPVAEAVAETEMLLDRQKVASLAYGYWLERGCPCNSPQADREADWFRAESELRSRIASTIAEPAAPDAPT